MINWRDKMEYYFYNTNSYSFLFYMYGTDGIVFLIYVIIKTDDQIFNHCLIFSWISITMVWVVNISETMVWVVNISMVWFVNISETMVRVVNISETMVWFVNIYETMVWVVNIYETMVKNGRQYFAHLCNIMIKENTDNVT